MAVRIIHNPRCSKSRQTLELIKKQNIEPEIVEYLKDPLSREEISQILNLLEVSARDIMRKKENIYKDNHLDDSSFSDADLVEKMVEHPILIERPIVVVDGKKAAICRPPENVLELIVP